MRKIVLALAAASTLAACAIPDYYPDGRGIAAGYAPYAGEVQMLSAFPAEGSYDRLGTIVVRGGYMHGTEHMTNVLKERAAQAGGNAVVVQQGRTLRGISASLLQQAPVELTGVAIRAKD